MPLRFETAGKTHVGLVRTSNEDCLHIDEKNAVFAVCDGMGGHQAGEVASMTAAHVLQTSFNNFPEELHGDTGLNIERTLPRSGELLLKSIRLANRAIYKKALGNASLAGMGTTIVAFALQDNMMSIAHVGDSRAYRIEDKQIVPLTVDHSWVAEIQQNQHLSELEAATMVGKNVITRALGVRDTVEVDYRLIEVEPGEKFFLCSDGLCGFADDNEIFSAVNKVRHDNERIVDRLIQMANDRGGMDNVTVVVIEILDTDKPSGLPEVEPFTLPQETPEQLEHEDAWIEKMDSLLAEKEEALSEAARDRPVSKSILFAIFALFVIVALVIVYFSTGK